MTANEARALTAGAVSPDAEKVSVVLELWHRGIRKAADEGRSAVCRGELDVVRTPIPESAWRAAVNHLRAAGFQVERVIGGRNESDVQASW